MSGTLQNYIFVFEMVEKKLPVSKSGLLRIRQGRLLLKLIMRMIPTVCSFHGIIINDLVVTEIALSSSDSIGLSFTSSQSITLRL